MEANYSLPGQRGRLIQIAIPNVAGAAVGTVVLLLTPGSAFAAIVPFNFPLLLMAWKVAPAIVAGNTVVCKPPHQNPLSNLLMAECYEPLPPQTEEAEAYQRLAARVDAVEELAAKGYVNSWLRENVLARLRNDLQSIRMGMREGDEWRTEDWRMREVDPGEIERVLERIESALSRLGGT
jgi:hypothetical protein